MAFGATDIPPRGVDDFRETLRVREVKLANAKKQRDVILIDIRKAQVAADMGDQRARFELAGLNKQDLAAGRLVLSLEAEVAQSRKRVEMAEAQDVAKQAAQASVDAVNVRRDKLFEVVCPDGRRVRHRGASQEDVRRRLQFGALVGQVHGADADGIGGFVPRPGFLTAMLEAYEGELIEWLEARGISGGGKTTEVLPSNGRELQ